MKKWTEGDVASGLTGDLTGSSADRLEGRLVGVADQVRRKY